MENVFILNKGRMRERWVERWDRSKEGRNVMNHTRV